MTISYMLNGRKISETKARAAWIEYDTMNAGSDPAESVAVFARAKDRDMDGEQAREYMLDAGIEVFFHGTGSSYDAEG